MTDLILSVDQTQIVYGGAPGATLTLDDANPQSLVIDAIPQASIAVIALEPTLIAGAEQGPQGIQGVPGPVGPRGVQGPAGIIDTAFVLDGGAF